MATQKGKDAFAFVKDYLAKKPSATFAEVRDAAKASGHKTHPIVFGRAKLLLGQVKAGAGKGKKKAAKKRSATKKTARKSAAKKAGRKAAAKAAPVGRPRGRKPGRPAKVAAGSGIEGIVAHVREIERERDQLRATIEKLRGLLRSV